MTITRKQYLSSTGTQESAMMHALYYRQFANDQVVNYVAGKFSPEELVEAFAEDENLNTIPLARWDDAARAVYPWIDQELVKSTGTFWSLSCGVCTVKKAALHLLAR